MGYKELRDRLNVFDQTIANMHLSIEDGSLTITQFNLIRQFLQDEISMSEVELDIKYTKEDNQFKSFYDASMVVQRLTDAVVCFKDQSQLGLKRYLKTIFAGSLNQDFEPQQAKDYFYEIEMASLYKKAGFIVELREPDIVISDNGLTKPYGIACKYPSSENQIHRHISKGYKQITNQNIDGLVMVGLDQIVFKGMNKFIDFRQHKQHPRAVMQRITDEAMLNLVPQRSMNYPAECPINGAIITLTASGIYGKPAGLITVRTMTLQCDNKNPMKTDIQLMVRKLKQLK